MSSAVPFSLLLRLIEILLARALRLSFPGVLLALKVGLLRHIRRHVISRRIWPRCPERMTGLCLELLGNVVLRPTAATAMGMASLGQLLLELIAAILPDVAHN